VVAVCGRSPAEIVGSNSISGMDVCLLVLPCVLSGRGLSVELITRPEESYRVWCVEVCDLETSWMRRLWPTGGGGSCYAENKILTNLWMYCYCTVDVLLLHCGCTVIALWMYSYCTVDVLSFALWMYSHCTVDVLSLHCGCTLIALWTPIHLRGSESKKNAWPFKMVPTDWPKSR
jgi:hypothetical protein